MFSLFKKNKSEKKIIRDKIVMTQKAKWQTLNMLYRNDPSVSILFWFEETLRNAQEEPGFQTELLEKCVLVNQAHSSQLEGKKIIFAEHYPLIKKEKEFFEQMQLTEAEVWSAMDEPIFKEFGGDKIVPMMKQLGVQDDQVIEHTMISNAINNAQQKIENKVKIDKLSTSQEDWLVRNLRSV
ncbi:MAG: hypothetical protein JST10_03275 [Bacteroidetes bacterium]|nr:hypothetical protein [Bacteroidota bacterium]